MAQVSIGYVYTPAPGATLRHHSIPPSQPFAVVPGSPPDGPQPLNGILPSGTAALTFPGFRFMFWSVTYTGVPASNNYVVNQPSLGSVLISNPTFNPSIVQILAWYYPLGGIPGPSQVWIDAFDISVGNFSNDSTIVQVVPGSPTIQSNANQQGIVYTNLQAEQIQAKAALQDSTVFNHWGWVFGDQKPEISVDAANNKQLDANQNSNGYYIAFYTTPPPDPCAALEAALAAWIQIPPDERGPGWAAELEKLAAAVENCRKAHGEWPPDRKPVGQ